MSYEIDNIVLIRLEGQNDRQIWISVAEIESVLNEGRAGSVIRTRSGVRYLVYDEADAVIAKMTEAITGVSA
jgi:uncharacterized protein YlzI (FlbEa/FlbD family)